MKKKIIITLSIIGILGVVGFVGVTVVNNMRVKEVNTLYEEGKVYEAYTKVMSLHGESATALQERIEKEIYSEIMLEVEGLMELGEWDEALEVLDTLPFSSSSAISKEEEIERLRYKEYITAVSDFVTDLVKAKELTVALTDLVDTEWTDLTVKGQTDNVASALEKVYESQKADIELVTTYKDNLAEILPSLTLDTTLYEMLDNLYTKFIIIYNELKEPSADILNYKSKLKVYSEDFNLILKDIKAYSTDI